MTKYYRAKITLEEITPLPTPDEQTYENVRASELAEITVAAGDPGSAMAQIVKHAERLAETHAEVIVVEQPDPWAPPPNALELLDGKKQ